MNWKIFLSTFVLIFLAELGDKTQLAAMARATTSESAKWTVFAAASSALVLSTFIAVLLGSVLSKYIDPKHLKIAAGIMFLIFGAIILWRAFVPEKEVQVEASPAVGHFVLSMAMEFEKAAFDDYRTMAGKAVDKELRTLLEQLAEEEGDHLKQLTEYSQKPDDLFSSADGYVPEEKDKLHHDISASDRPVLEHAIEHELATADFYAELAHLTMFPSLKNTFLTLSKAEHRHADKLRSFAGMTDSGDDA